MVQVTRHTTQDSSATLRCWALGFYPQDISLSWWLGEQELVLETEYMETRPRGDGTYQTWAAVQVPAGEEAAYTCRVQHSGLNDVLTVAWGEALGLAGRGNEGRDGPRALRDSPTVWGGAPFSLPSLESPSSQRLIAMVTCPLLFLLAVGVVILTTRYLQGRWDGNKAGGPPAGPAHREEGSAPIPAATSVPEQHLLLRPYPHPTALAHPGALRTPPSGETAGLTLQRAQRGRSGEVETQAPTSIHHSPHLLFCVLSHRQE